MRRRAAAPSAYNNNGSAKNLMLALRAGSARRPCRCLFTSVVVEVHRRNDKGAGWPVCCRRRCRQLASFASHALLRRPPSPSPLLL